MGWIWDYGRHFCLINRSVFMLLFAPRRLVEGPWDIPRSCRICFSCQILLLVYLFQPAPDVFTFWKIWWLHVHDVSARFACQIQIQLTSSLATFIPVTEVSSLFISFYSSASHRQMTCQDGYEFIGGEQGTQPSCSAQWTGRFRWRSRLWFRRWQRYWVLPQQQLQKIVGTPNPES